MTAQFCASDLGGAEPRVLARFVKDAEGLHSERFDRATGHWLHDNRVAGFLTGHDDWARRVTKNEAAQIIQSWGFDRSLLTAAGVEGAAT